jgi:hypothetical protein
MEPTDQPAGHAVAPKLDGSLSSSFCIFGDGTPLDPGVAGQVFGQHDRDRGTVTPILRHCALAA